MGSNEIQVGPGSTDAISNVTIQNFKITSNTSFATASGGADVTAATFTLANREDAQTTIGTLDTMIDAVGAERSNVGSLQNRLEYTSSNLMSSIQNNAASMSTIRDADFAAEAADLARNQILTQSGTAILAQANGLSQNVLALIR